MGAYVKRKSQVTMVILCATIIAGAAGSLLAQDANTFPAWPRTHEKDGNIVVVYQPQVDGWKDYSKIRFRMVVAVTPKGAESPSYGVAAVEADTLVDHDARMVMMTNMDMAVRFPGVSDANAAKLRAVLKDFRPSGGYLDVPLEEVLAYMHEAPAQPKADVNLNPPPIFYSDVPAILVNYLGPPQFKPIAGTKLMFAVNTNWVVLLDMNASQYYLLDGNSWLMAPDPLKGPWIGAGELPSDCLKLAADPNWAQVSRNIPGQPAAAIPIVYTSTEPAELIITNGVPQYTPISGAGLMYVSNPVMPLFMDMVDGNHYYLVAGRWFKAADLNGPWSAASANLPAEFAKIPQNSPVGFVLASVPGTLEAKDAVMLASVPHKATVNIKETTVNVVYAGTPKFVPIQGTPMTYAVNTSYQVVFASAQYYCCCQGVWFIAPTATGPWTVCTAVPAVIYTIPPSCPLYNTTYVHVYSTTPTTVVVGYTEGYSGAYVATTGALMFGAGMLTGALLASDSSYYYYQCYPCYYSYGCAAHYSYAYGVYYRAGGAYYGPYGGAGWGSAYNPATGTWARAGYAYGPGGERWGAQAYNPFTNTFAQHTGGANGYQSWGSSVVSQDGKWAQAGHVSGPEGTKAYAQTSSGQWAAGAHRTGGGTMAATSSGNLYAGKDGNVYKRDSDGQWQTYQGGGSWQDVSAARPAQTAGGQYQQQAATRQAAGMQSNWQNSWKNDWNSNQWKNNFESNGGWQNRFSQSDTLNGLNRDWASRNQGSSNAFSLWQSRSGGGFGGGRFGGGGFGGGGFGGFDGGGGFRR
jgi:hypothetical protein